MWNLADTFFGDHATNLVRNPLHVLFADDAAGLDGNLFDNLLGDHSTNRVRHLRHDGFRNHLADGDWTGLTYHLRLVGRAGDLSFDNVRAPDSFTGVEARHLNHADLRTARAANHLWTAGTLIVDLLLSPPTTILFFRPICIFNCFWH